MISNVKTIGRFLTPGEMRAPRYELTPVANITQVMVGCC